MKNHNAWGLSFHHLGLAVANPEGAARYLEGLGYTAGPDIFDPLQHVRLCMYEHATMPDVEIVYPQSSDSPIKKIVEKNQNGLVYHICYTTDDLDATLEQLGEEGGFRLFEVAPPTPAVLFGGKSVSFYVIDGFGLIEILENG